MSRRLREARKAGARPTVVIQVPQRIDRATAADLLHMAKRSMPGRRVLVVDSGATVVNA